MSKSKTLYLRDINSDFCYNCGSKLKDTGASLHCWSIEYECGSQIWGPIDMDDKGTIDIGIECPNKNKK